MSKNQPIDRQKLLEELSGRTWQMFANNSLTPDEAQVVMATALNSVFLYIVNETENEASLEEMKDRFCGVLSQVVADTAAQIEEEKPQLPEYPY